MEITLNNPKQNQTQKRKQIIQLMVKPIMKDEEITKKEGNYFPEKHYSNIINKDCDVYYLDNNQKNFYLNLEKESYHNNNVKQHIKTCIKPHKKETEIVAVHLVW